MNTLPDWQRVESFSVWRSTDRFDWAAAGWHVLDRFPKNGYYRAGHVSIEGLNRWNCRTRRFAII